MENRMVAMKVKLIKAEGNRVTVELPEGASIDAEAEMVLEVSTKEGANGSEAQTDEERALAGTEEYPEPKTEFARKLIESLKAARKAYVKSGGRFLSHNDLDVV
jgi:hypothetical protein